MSGTEIEPSPAHLAEGYFSSEEWAPFYDLSTWRGTETHIRRPGSAQLQGREAGEEELNSGSGKGDVIHTAF